MRKIFTFMLLAAALLVSVPSSAYVPGELHDFTEYNFPDIGNAGNSNDYGTLCFPGRIVAVQGITIYDVFCVDMFYNGNGKDSTKVARLVVDVHKPCYGLTQYDPITDSWDEPFCPTDQGTAYGLAGSDNPCDKKVFIDWVDWPNEDYPYIDHRMVIGGAYFYTICKDDDPKIQPAPYDSAATYKSHRKIWLDNSVLATEPVSNNGFWGTFKETKINEPVTVFTKDINSGQQFLEQVTSATIPAHRGYFKGYFECVPWRYNTDSRVEPHPHPDGNNNPLHYPCTGEVKEAPRRLSANAIAFNVGRDATTGLYQVDFEHPIYLNQETNKRIENGQLIIETADGTKYNAFGQRVK